MKHTLTPESLESSIKFAHPETTEISISLIYRFFSINFTSISFVFEQCKQQ